MYCIYTTPPLVDIEFPPTLSAQERGLAHHVANQMGLITKSVGKEPNRMLTVSRPGGRKGTTQRPVRAPPLSLHPQSEALLDTHLALFPLTAGDVAPTLLQDPTASFRHNATQYRGAQRGGRMVALDAAAFASALAVWQAAAEHRAASPGFAASMASRQSLPAWHLRNEVAAAMRTSQVRNGRKAPEGALVSRK